MCNEQDLDKYLCQVSRSVPVFFELTIATFFARAPSGVPIHVRVQRTLREHQVTTTEAVLVR